jgi:hypothetical protein
MDTCIAFKDILSPAATLLAATGAVLGVFFTLRANSRNQDKKQAFETYDAYLEKCFASPKLASGCVEIPEDYNGATDEFFKYEWLVSRFLLAAERILEITRNDVEWRSAIVSQARTHKEYFSSKFFPKDEFQMYSPEMREIIREVVSGQKRGEFNDG